MEIFERAHPLVACILYLAAWLVASGAVLWPFSRTRLIDRIPFVLCIVNALLGLAIDALPEAARGIFETVIRHSVFAMTTVTSGGTLVIMPWVESWQETIEDIFFWCAVGGAVWGLINLFRRRAWITNALAVGYTLWGLFYGLTHIL
ncbi:MAG: hypothetical protein WBE09_04860 [Candidatus Acidiferrales bacterium]